MISHGWWPGGGAVAEPAFYAYAAPEPDGFKTVPVEPAAAFYSHRFFGVHPALRGRADLTVTRGRALPLPAHDLRRRRRARLVGPSSARAVVGSWQLAVGGLQFAVPVRGSVFREGIIRIAVEPAFTRFGGGDHGMNRRVRVLRRVPVRRVVTAARSAAGLARAQVHPCRADLDALVTLISLRRCDALECVDVGASSGLHHSISRELPTANCQLQTAMTADCSTL